MNDLCIDIGFCSLNKHDEQLCGDQVVVERSGEDGAIVVLADGMGSGVKANILATLTAKILTTMMMSGISIGECVSTVAATLPICKVRKAAYSTFTALRLTDNTEAEIIQYDNPDVIVLKNGKSVDYPKTAMVIDDKTVYISKLRLADDHALVLISDGIIHTGIDGIIDQSWDRDVVAGYMECIYDSETSAKSLATLLLNECAVRYGGKIMDDTTACVVKIRKRRQVNLMIGPPADKIDDEKMMSLFFAKEGKSIICGGTTAVIASRFLSREIKTSLDYDDCDIPPTSEIRGVDLVTEGVLTVNRVMDYARDFLTDNNLYYKWCYMNDGASRIARLLFEEATDINFYVGEAVNPAHQNPALAINFKNKMRLIMELSECLKKMGKKIKISYFQRIGAELLSGGLLMNTLHFKYAVEVERTGSITQAADNLYMAQPNLSKAIKELEDTLGIPIFTRTSRGMVPTQKGSEFLVYAKNILTQVSEMEALYISDNGEKQRFSIVIPRGSYISSAFTRFVAELDPELEIDVDVKETNSMQAISDVAGGEYGIGIIRYQTFHERYFIDFLLSKDLAFDPIWEFKYLALMSRCHPLADEPEISFTELNRYIEIVHGDLGVPYLTDRELKREKSGEHLKKKIYVYERGSQFDMLCQIPTTYMWVSPIPEIWLTRYDLVQRKCTQAVNKYKDVLIYPKNYEFSQLDKKYLDKLYESKNEVALKIYA